MHGSETLFNFPTPKQGLRGVFFVKNELRRYANRLLKNRSKNVRIVNCNLTGFEEKAMKKRVVYLPVVLLFVSLACQAVTGPAPGAEPTDDPVFPTATREPAVALPEPTPTLEPVSEKSLAGLIVSSPAFGAQQDGGYWRGLGIVNAAGELIHVANEAWYLGYSPSGLLVYQHGYGYGLERYAYNLKVYHAATGATLEVDDGLEGIKEFLGWVDPARFVYANHYDWLLFEAYGYFEGSEVLIVDGESGQASLLFEHAFQFQPSPDRSKIAYTTGTKMDVDGENMQTGAGCFEAHIHDLASSASTRFETDGLTEQPLCMGYPEWSPDGKRIAWIGYFQDGTFHPIVFNLQDGTGVAYPEIQVHGSSQFPGGWNMGYAPSWVDETTLWTEAYEIDIQSGQEASPRENTWAFPSSSVVASPDGRLAAGLTNGVVEIQAVNGTALASYSLDELYHGGRNQIGFDAGEQFQAFIEDWGLFAPPAGVEGELQAGDVPSSTENPAATGDCSTGVVITARDTSKGDYLQICAGDEQYEIGPVAKGAFAVSPSGRFFVYCANNGIVYAALVGDLTLHVIGSVKDFAAIQRGDVPQFAIEFDDGDPSKVTIREVAYHQSQVISIPRSISAP